VAMLRGINVAGKTKIKMDDLRELFTGLGHTNVQTYLQSGNVVFATTVRDPRKLEAAAEQAIDSELGLQVAVLVRSHSELAAVLTANPYLDRETDLTKLPVTFLAEAPAPEAVAALQVPAGEPAVCTVLDREVYLHCPDGYGRTKLNNAFLERKLGVKATTRNWKSVTALHDISAS
jgi:uncharacterized protein (DUF1697 family)